MKNTFREFARLSTDELKALWAEAIIVFDTNILLNLYEYSQNTCDAVFEIMEKLNSQLWLPYKIGEEFYTKRISKIYTHNKSCDKIISLIDELLKIDKESCLYELLHDNQQLKVLKSEVEKKSKQNKLDIYNDPIVNKIEKLYDGRVGQKSTDAEIDEIEKEYRYKTANGIYCPGFKDSDKAKNSSGDFLLWKQMLTYAVKNKKSIIFVTEDKKEDWWWKPQHDCISARYELLKEFIKHTNGKIFYMYKFNDFTKAYAKYKKTKVDKKVTEEIKNTEEEKSATRNILAQVLAEKDSEIYTRFGSSNDIWKGLEEYNKIVNSCENAIKPLRDIQKYYETITAPLKEIQSVIKPYGANSLAKMLKNSSTMENKELICKTLDDDK